MSFHTFWSRLQGKTVASPARADPVPSGGPHVTPSLPELLRPLLAETIAWCSPKVVETAPQLCLRGEPFGDRSTYILEKSLVDDVARWRSARVGSLPPASNHHGRLLAYFPDLNLCDGAAEAESRGYLDVENCPPWETWIALALLGHFFLSIFGAVCSIAGRERRECLGEAFRPLH
jgi:hypothetical protein